MAIYLTAIWLTPGGSSTVHIYTPIASYLSQERIIFCSFTVVSGSNLGQNTVFITVYSTECRNMLLLVCAVFLPLVFHYLFFTRSSHRSVDLYNRDALNAGSFDTK
jgi:hypothetical protein